MHNCAVLASSASSARRAATQRPNCSSSWFGFGLGFGFGFVLGFGGFRSGSGLELRLASPRTTRRASLARSARQRPRRRLRRRRRAEAAASTLAAVRTRGAALPAPACRSTWPGQGSRLVWARARFWVRARVWIRVQVRARVVRATVGSGLKSLGVRLAACLPHVPLKDVSLVAHPQLDNVVQRNGPRRRH